MEGEFPWINSLVCVYENSEMDSYGCLPRRKMGSLFAHEWNQTSKVLFSLGPFHSHFWELSINHYLFPKPNLVFTCLQYKSFENTVGIGEIACNKQFLLSKSLVTSNFSFSHCVFLPFLRPFCRFYIIWKCLLQTLWVWKSLKFVVWESYPPIPGDEILDCSAVEKRYFENEYKPSSGDGLCHMKGRKLCWERRKRWILLQQYFNPIPDDKFLDSSKLKEFADDNFTFDENGKKLSKRVENTVGKGEIARYEQFLLYPQCFQKACFPGVSKGVIVWEWVKLLFPVPGLYGEGLEFTRNVMDISNYSNGHKADIGVSKDSYFLSNSIVRTIEMEERQVNTPGSQHFFFHFEQFLFPNQW